MTLSGDPGYDVLPITDTPSGLLGAIKKYMFDAADTHEQRAYLAALAAVDNPLSHTAETVACVACHVSTVVMSARAIGHRDRPADAPRALHVEVRSLHRGRPIGGDADARSARSATWGRSR